LGDKNNKKPKISKSSLKQTARLFKYLKPFKWEFMLGLFFLVLTSFASLAFPKYLGDLVDSAANDLFDKIDQVAMILIVILIAQAVFAYFRIIIFVRVTQKMLAALRQATFAHLIRLPMTFFSKKRVGELNSRISADVALLQETFTTTLAEFIRQLIIIIGGITLLAFTSVQLTLFMLAILPAVIIAAIIFGRFIRRYSKEVQAQVAESNTIVEETLQGITNVKAFTNEWWEILRYTKKTDEVAQTAIKGGAYRAAFASFIITGLFGAIVAVIWKGATLVNAGELQIGQLFSFVIYSGFIGGSIGGLADVYAKIQKAIGATEELMEILDEEIEDIPEKQKAQGKLDGEIAFEGVHFTYPSRKEIQVLSDINFKASPGQQIALVGASGAGKSTLVGLLYQFYLPSEGSILFDGKSSSDYELQFLRSQMALVPQDVLLFGGTIKENIGYGDTSADDEMIQKAARLANAHQFIETFPETYKTIVGDRGIQLSGGQRQRIAIARAILKDPRILVLDEATSSLDTESERLVQEALEKLMKGRTTFVIAHRLSTIRNANMILVMENGRIAEKGTHDELLKKPGIYKKLVENQLQL